MLTSPTTDFSLPVKCQCCIHLHAKAASNFQHTPGHKNVAPCAGNSLDYFLSRICPFPTRALPSSPWIQFNSWRGPGIVPQSGLCAATLF